LFLESRLGSLDSLEDAGFDGNTELIEFLTSSLAMQVQEETVLN